MRLREATNHAATTSALTEIVLTQSYTHFERHGLISLPVLNGRTDERSISTAHSYSTQDLTIIAAEFNFEFVSKFIKSNSSAPWESHANKGYTDFLGGLCT